MDATAGDDQLDLRAKADRIAAKIALREAEYRNAIALNPNDFRAYIDLAVILGHKGDSVGAHSAQADSYFALARLYEAKGDLKMAEITFRTAQSCQRKIGGGGEATHAVGGDTAAPVVERNTVAPAVEGTTATPAFDPEAAAANTIETDDATPPAIGGDDTLGVADRDEAAAANTIETGEADRGNADSHRAGRTFANTSDLFRIFSEYRTKLSTVEGHAAAHAVGGDTATPTLEGGGIFDASSAPSVPLTSATRTSSASRSPPSSPPRTRSPPSTRSIPASSLRTRSTPAT
jgi:hypothetical protein